jgi:hypothetical protein
MKRRERVEIEMTNVIRIEAANTKSLQYWRRHMQHPFKTPRERPQNISLKNDATETDITTNIRE